MPKRRRDEEEDEESDEEYVPAVKKKRKRRAGMSFLDFEAQEDDAGGEDDVELEDDDGGFLDDSAEAAEAAELALSHRRKVEEELARDGAKVEGRGRAGNLYYNTIGDLERRYAESGGFEDNTEGAYDAGYASGDEEYLDDPALELQRMLPGAWKLWKVKTIRPGIEREACVAVLRKFSQEKNKASFMIASAFASDSVKGSIYVEAPSQNAIQKHLGDVRFLLTNAANVKRVPVKEMTDVFQMDARREEMPRIGEWVRFIRGQYAGDLGLVSEIDEGAGSVIVRLIPRIDLSYEQRLIYRQDGDNVTPPPQKDRPPPRRILMSELESYQIETERPHYFTECVKFRNYIIEEQTGFLLRSVKPHGLLRGAGVRPTAEEFARFQEPGVDLSELVNAKVNMTLSTGSDDSFAIGQPVTIISGDLAGLAGFVSGKDISGELKIQTKEGGAGETVSALPDQCRKEFSIGDSVKVISGQHQGESGLVTKSHGTTCSILSSESHQQITVDVNQLSIASNDSHSSAGLTRLEGYAVGDFVLIAGSTQAGVIVKITRSKRLDVLTKDGVETVEVGQLSGKHNIRAVKEQDANNNEFGVGSAVEILEPPHQGTMGTVKYLWKETAFVTVPAAPNGLVAVSCASVRLEQPSDAAGSPGGPMPGGPGPQNQRPRGQIGFRTQFSIMGTQIKLIAGDHKGLKGELRGIQGSEAVVLVSALGAEVRVPRNYVQLVNESSEAAKFFRRRPTFDRSRA